MMNKGCMCIGMLAFVMLTSCHHHESTEHEEGSEVEKAEGHSDEIVYEKAAAKAAGVVAETVGMGTFAGVIPASGKVLSASDDETVVVANVSGIVHFSRNISVGMKTEKGSPVFLLSAEHLQDGDPAERASVAYETAKNDYERAARLVKEKIISEKEFNVVKGLYEEARIAYKATAQNRLQNATAVKSPVDGYVKSCMVSEGDYVSVGQPLMRIARNNKLYLQADVAARHYSAFERIRSAKFRTSYSDSIYDTERMNGRLLSYGRTMNDASGYVTVTFEMENTASLLPGSFADIYIQTDEEREAVSVPLSAITEEQGVKFVYIQEDDDCYRKQEVKLGMSDGERTEILSGVNVGDRVVTQGAVRVKLVAAGNAIPAHTHSH